MSDPQVLGLVTAAGLRLAPGAMPDIVARSPECVGISSPRPEARIDLVFFPTRDILNLLDVGPDDAKYLMGCIALMHRTAQDRGMNAWRILSNGPGAQQIAYLHFHLVQD